METSIKGNGGWLQLLDRLFLLSWRKVIVALVVCGLAAGIVWAVAEAFDGRMFVLDGLATAAFYVGTLVIPLYLIVGLVYTAVRRLQPKQYLLLSRWTLLVLPAFVVAVLLHNFVYALFYPAFLREDGDEGIFFVVALLGIPIYLVVVLVYSAWVWVGRLRSKTSGH